MDSNMISGIAAIAKERVEQVQKHKRTVDYDVHHNIDSQLNDAIRILVRPYDIIADGYIIPKGWDRNIWLKMIGKPYKERLIIAGALIAAEIDRLQNTNP